MLQHSQSAAMLHCHQAQPQRWRGVATTKSRRIACNSSGAGAILLGSGASRAQCVAAAAGAPSAAEVRVCSSAAKCRCSTLLRTSNTHQHHHRRLHHDNQQQQGQSDGDGAPLPGLRVYAASTAAEFRAAGYLRARSFYSVPEGRSEFAARASSL